MRKMPGHLAVSFMAFFYSFDTSFRDAKAMRSGHDDNIWMRVGVRARMLSKSRRVVIDEDQLILELELKVFCWRRISAQVLPKGQVRTAYLPANPVKHATY